MTPAPTAAERGDELWRAMLARLADPAPLPGEYPDDAAVAKQASLDHLEY